MKKSKIITLTTDFGEGSFYVGSMKGVILSINPRATVVDVTHSIAPGDILCASYTIFVAYRYFPRGAIHVIVVDPGVGGKRRILGASIDGHIFLAPDNGVLSFILQKKEPQSIVELKRKDYFLKDVSSTFHGRDIFAPAAAHLSKGLALSKLGPRASRITRAEMEAAKITGSHIAGSIIYVDSFGNCVSNISRKTFGSRIDKDRTQVRIKGKRIKGISGFYSESEKGRLIALFGSAGFLEVAVVGGNAAKKLNIQPPCPIELTLS